METSTKRSVQLLVAIAKQRGVQHIVFSPGSRNAPLVIGFNADPYFKCLNIPDERAAAFFALGMMQFLQAPVAICCTSGSAAVNYYPAIAEAFYQKLPLVVLTADRPMAWIDQGDGQTIRQQNVFSNHVKFSANLMEDDDGEALWYNKRVMNEAFDATLWPEAGPVHINLPFREPLYKTTSNWEPAPRAVRTTTAKAELNPNALARLAIQWNQSARKMVILGQMLPNHTLDPLVAQLTADPSVIVFTESTSNVKAAGMFNCIDRLLSTWDVKVQDTLQPEILLTMGGAVVSKRIKAFLRQFPETVHWHVQPALPHPDTYQLLTEQILATAEDFLQQFTPLIQAKPSAYKTQLLAADAQSDAGHAAYGALAPWSDWKVYHHLLPHLQPNMALQSANSSVIRYLQLFKSGRNLPHYCNRGTSGIDGSTSTAAGFCHVAEKPTLLITGDISFFYDSNGLYHKYLNKNFKILLINNGGGGIFRIIDGPKDSTHLEQFFEAAQNISAAPLATAFGLHYLTANNEADYLRLLPTFLAPANQPTIFEVFTPQKENATALNNYFKTLKNES